MHHQMVFSFVGLLLVVSVTPADDIPAPRSVPVAALITQLRSSSVAERNAAAERLAALSIVPEELAQAAKSRDYEVREPASAAVEAIQKRRAERILGPAWKFVRDGDVSLFVAASAKWDLPADGRRVWDVPFDLADNITNPARVGPWKGLGDTPWRDPNYFRLFFPEYVLIAGRYTPKVSPHFVAADEYDAERPFSSIIIARQKVKTQRGIINSALFCNTNLERFPKINSSLVVCDGDVQVERVSSSVIITRGNIRVTRFVADSILIAGGDVTCDWDEATKPEHRNRFESRQSNPLEFVKFFELSRVGVEVSAKDKVVRITGAVEGKTFAKAGATLNDIIESVNGTKPESVESLRKLLRDALAVGDATVAVRRGDKVEKLRITLSE